MLVICNFPILFEENLVKKFCELNHLSNIKKLKSNEKLKVVANEIKNKLYKKKIII